MALFQHGSSDVIDLDSVGTSKSFFSMSPWQFTCRQSGMTWVVRVCVAKRGLSWSVVNFIRCSDELQLKRHLFLNHEHGALWLLICSRHRTTLTCLLAYLDIYISKNLVIKCTFSCLAVLRHLKIPTHCLNINESHSQGLNFLTRLL